MIQPIKSNINFTGNEAAVQEKKKFNAKETFNKVKKGVTDVGKDIITAVNVGGGAIDGVRDAFIVTGATAMVGKALRASKDEKGLKVLGSIATNLIKDTWGGIKGVASWGKRVLTEDKATYKHLGEIFSLPKKFYTSYMKNNKGIAAFATVLGISVFAFRLLQGKIKANEQKANLDHRTNQGHV